MVSESRGGISPPRVPRTVREHRNGDEAQGRARRHEGLRKDPGGGAKLRPAPDKLSWRQRAGFACGWRGGRSVATREHPDRYRLAVSYRDADVLDAAGVRFLGFSVRFHEMSPRDSHNLGQFLERYRRLGRYCIAPMECRPAGGVTRTATHPGISIEKRLLKVVPGWKIGPDDFLRAALPGVTNSVIPSGEEDPPFHRPSTGGPVGFDDDA